MSLAAFASEEEHLSLIDEGLTALPELGAAAASLTALNVHSNALTSLAGLISLPRLTELDLSSNALDSLAASESGVALRDLGALVSLDLACNRIADAAPLADLCALVSLNLSFNRLRTLDGLAAGGAAHTLRTLDVRGNRIATARGVRCVARLKALTTLCLQSRDGSCSNPICVAAEEYRSGVCHLALRLELLDGWPTARMAESGANGGGDGAEATALALAARAPPGVPMAASPTRAAIVHGDIPPRSPPPLMPHFDRLSNLRAGAGAARRGVAPKQRGGARAARAGARAEAHNTAPRNRRAQLARRLKALQREAQDESEDMERFMADPQRPPRAGTCAAARRRRVAAPDAAPDAAPTESDRSANGAADGGASTLNRLADLQREIDAARNERAAATALLAEHEAASGEAEAAHSAASAATRDALAQSQREAAQCEALLAKQQLALDALAAAQLDAARAATSAENDQRAQRSAADVRAEADARESAALRTELASATAVEQRRSAMIAALSTAMTERACAATELEKELASAAGARASLVERAEVAEREVGALRARIDTVQRAHRDTEADSAARTRDLQMRAAELAASAQLATYEREHSGELI